MDVQLVEQGRSEYAKLSEEERANIVHQFQEVTSGMKKSRLKTQFWKHKKVDMKREGSTGEEKSIPR